MRTVDIVLERDDGTIGAIEAKVSATVKASDLSGPQVWAGAGADILASGVVLHDSAGNTPFGDGLMAPRLSCPWM